jgi:hypothetical protein
MSHLPLTLVSALAISAFAAFTSGTAIARDGASNAPAPGEAAKLDCKAADKPCKMHDWMKSTMQAAVQANDKDKIAAALGTVAAWKAPADYKEWAKIAKEGQDKAKAGDIDGAKKSCKACHDLYKKDYIEKHRGSKFP